MNQPQIHPIEAELVRATRVGPTAGEPRASYLIKLLNAGQNVSTTIWRSLSPEATRWYNYAVTAYNSLNNEQDIPDFHETETWDVEDGESDALPPEADLSTVVEAVKAAEAVADAEDLEDEAEEAEEAEDEGEVEDGEQEFEDLPIEAASVEEEEAEAPVEEPAELPPEPAAVPPPKTYTTPPPKLSKGNAKTKPKVEAEAPRAPLVQRPAQAKPAPSRAPQSKPKPQAAPTKVASPLPQPPPSLPPKPGAPGAMTIIKRRLLASPNVTNAELDELCRAHGVPVSNITIATIRSDFRHSVKILQEVGYCRELNV